MRISGVPTMIGLNSVSERQRTILVVDDNAGVLEFLTLLLTKHGFSTLAASNGMACLDLVRSRTVDLIILDVMMPVMDGLQVCQELKKLAPRTPVILLTARDDIVTRAAAMDLGVSEFVAKPVNNTDLLNRVRTQLENLAWDRAAEEVFARIREAAAPADKKR
jgi:DNA-binding response OmpR family regulator